MISIWVCAVAMIITGIASYILGRDDSRKEKSLKYYEGYRDGYQDMLEQYKARKED